MKYSLKHIAVSIGFLAATSGTGLAQTYTIFNDDFATDASDPTANYLLGVSGGTESWASGTGITLGGGGTGKLEDVIGSFSTVTLANTGDYVSFVVNFNSSNFAGFGTGLAGDINFALDNSFGVSPLADGSTESVNSTTGGGATASYEGYLGDIGFDNSPKTGSKMFAKTGTGNNNLSYNSNVSTKAQVGASVSNGNNANLVDGDSYTLTYTITALNTGASQMQITEQIYDNTLSTMVDNFTTPATNGPSSYLTPTASFNVFDVGLYTGSEPSGNTLNISGAQLVTDVAPSPEPTALALGSAGLGLLGMFRMRRRK